MLTTEQWFEQASERMAKDFLARFTSHATPDQLKPVAFEIEHMYARHVVKRISQFVDLRAMMDSTKDQLVLEASLRLLKDSRTKTETEKVPKDWQSHLLLTLMARSMRLVPYVPRDLLARVQLWMTRRIQLRTITTSITTRLYLPPYPLPPDIQFFHVAQPVPETLKGKL